MTARESLIERMDAYAVPDSDKDAIVVPSALWNEAIAIIRQHDAQQSKTVFVKPHGDIAQDTIRTLRSGGLGDAKPNAEAKEQGVEVPPAAPEILIQVLEAMCAYHGIDGLPDKDMRQRCADQFTVAIMQLRAYIAEQRHEIRLTKEEWANAILADFQTENNRTKADEWEAAYALLFRQFNELAAMKREPQGEIRAAGADEEWLADQFFEKGKQYSPAPSHYICKEFAKIVRHVLKHSRYEIQASQEPVTPARDRGLPMSEIQVGMKLRHTVDTILPVITVTGHTEKGFTYSHERFFWRPGEWSEGGECYGQGGYSYYKPEREHQP